MRYVIAYDIVNDRRRNRVAHIAEAYGERVQYSVFEVELDDVSLTRLLKRLADVINTDEDSLRVYALCHACAGRACRLGVNPRDPLRERQVIIA